KSSLRSMIWQMDSMLSFIRTIRHPWSPLLLCTMSVQKMKTQSAQVLLTFLNTFYLKEQKTLKEESGLILLVQTEGVTMQILPQTELTITKYSLPTMSNWDCGWNRKDYYNL